MAERKPRKDTLERIVRDGAALIDQRQSGYTWRDNGHYFYSPNDIRNWLVMQYNAAVARAQR